MDTIRKYTLPACFLLVPFAILSTGLIHISHIYALTISALIISAAQGGKSAYLPVGKERKFFLSPGDVIFLFACYVSVWQVV